MKFLFSMKAALIGCLALTITALAFAPMAIALDPKASAPAEVYAGGGAGMWTSSGYSAPYLVPSGYIIYSGDGATFRFKRWFPAADVVDTVATVVPANRSLTIPAPPPYAISGVYYHSIQFDATAVTDSIFIIPVFE